MSMCMKRETRELRGRLRNTPRVGFALFCLEADDVAAVAFVRALVGGG